MATATDGRMLLDLLHTSALFLLLHRIDVDLAEKARLQGCAHCPEGVLHFARYVRKPRGGPADLPAVLCVRHSLCCNTCRRRVLPPSVLFFGRRVYWGVVVLLVVALRQNRHDSVSLHKLARLLGVARSTVWRWMEFFAVFEQTQHWKQCRGRVDPLLDRTRLLGALLDTWLDVVTRPTEAVVGFVAFLSVPLSSRSVMAR